jgi:hypothetical protein
MRKLLLIAVPVVLVAGLGLATPKEVEVKKPVWAAVVKGNNQFAFDLYGQLREKEGNNSLI